MKSGSPDEIVESIPQKEIKIESHKVQQSLHKKFQNFLTGQRQQHLNQRVRNFYGKNFAINYRPQYKFAQQWQSKCSNQKQSDRNLLEQNGAGYLTYSLVFMVVNIAAVWALSFQRYFDTKVISQQSYIYEIVLALTLADAALNIYFQYSLIDSYRFQPLRQLKANKKHLVVITYMLFVLFDSTNETCFYFVELLVMACLYMKAAETYKSIKVTDWSLKYENQIKIFDLLFNVFIQAHVFVSHFNIQAIILFSASKINPNKNWVDAIGIKEESPIHKYTYSVYFASTTMLTIGYGDVTPKCPEEIIITILIEIVAVVSFGYLLNEMGHTLSKMREESEALERDLQTLSKISKYYNLERKLQNRAKSFLFSNQVRSEELKGEDESRVLMKLNEELRQEINHENSLTVVKSCVFFLCHWSKHLQSEVARRLEKRLFAPNEKLVAANSLPRVYIVKRGRVDVSMNRYGSNQDHRRLLKVIDTSRHGDVADNIYGYTTVFSNRAVRLEAVAKEFTSTYSVTREEFLDCVRQNVNDFEYFHEIKCRIDQSSFCEEWEAPSIKNIREHFVPSRIIVIKKFRYHLQNSLNKRKSVIRRKKSHKKFRLLEIYLNRDTGAQTPTVQKTIVFTTRKFDQIQLNHSDEPLSSQLSINVTSQEEIPSQVSQDSLKLSYKHAIASLKTRSKTTAFDETANKLLIAHNFEAYKEFTNFFKRNNISNVLHGLESENFMERHVHNGKSLFSVTLTAPLLKESTHLECTV